MGIYRAIQCLTVGDRSKKGVTGANSGTEGICAVAERGLQCVQGVCTGADRGCTGDCRENTGGERKRQGRGISYGLGFSKPVAFEY